MTKIETTSKVSLKLPNKINLGRPGARAELSTWELRTEIYPIFSPNAGKCGPVKTTDPDTLHAANMKCNASFTKDWSKFKFDWECFKRRINWSGHIVKNRLNSLLIILHKKWSLPLRISSVNVTKFAGNCGFEHIYRRIL